MHAVSRDLGLDQSLELEDGRRMTALDLQWQLLSAARDHAGRGGLDVVGAEVVDDLLARWETVLSGLESDPFTLADQLDWVAKLRLFNAYRERHGIEWGDARLVAMDLQYHDLRPASSLARRVGLATVADPAEVQTAVTEPPADTRAFFRGRCLERFADDVVSANWDSVVFDVGGSSLQRVPMMEPGKGTAEHVGALFDEVSSAAELLERLGR
jgi:proteasome accessory factor A